MLEKNYIVIGGQYKSFYYGESNSIRGAKIIARRNKEYWDNWQGWHIPNIYKKEDCYRNEKGNIIIKPYAENIK